MLIISKIISKIKQKLYYKFNSFKQKFITPNKYMEESRRLSSLNWHKIGTVNTLLTYPLISGNAEKVESCYLHFNKTIGFENGLLILNHMFAVYDESNHIIQTAKDIFNLTEIMISRRDECTVILRGVNMEDMPINLKTFTDEFSRNYKICMASFYGELLVQIKVLDCGQKVAEWLKSYTKKENLRLGYVLQNLKPQTIFMQEYRKLVSEKGDYENIMIPLENIPQLTLLSSTSFDEVKKTLSYMSVQRLSPNIIFTTTSEMPFDEMKWQYIKIGDAIINNVKLWKRSESPLSLTDISTNIRRQNILLHCEILLPGIVKKGDNVYIAEAECN